MKFGLPVIEAPDGNVYIGRQGNKRGEQMMKIGVLGTGPVGQAVAARLSELGHTVLVGTRDPAATLARTAPGTFGNAPFKVWREQHPDIELGTFARAASHADLVVNATQGSASLEALKAAGERALAEKILVDMANPLDFSKGVPLSLTVCNNDSLGEQIQRAFPLAKVVKTLNTMYASLLVSPRQLADGAHTAFVSGNDGSAKETVIALLESFGWHDVFDLGDITTARGPEMMLPLWVRIFGATQSPMFAFKLVR
jgi:predicted dinucleotide-binding enzyme